MAPNFGSRLYVMIRLGESPRFFFFLTFVDTTMGPRTKQTAKKATGGDAPRIDLGSMTTSVPETTGIVTRSRSVRSQDDHDDVGSESF